MTRFIEKNLITLFMGLISFSCYSQTDSIAQFTDYNKILGFESSSGDRILVVDSFSVDWGQNVLNELNLNGQTNFEKALRIKNFIHMNIDCYGRQSNIHDIIKERKGNCYDHARLSVFLLRMSGVPAKFAFEINLKKNVFWWGNKAKKQNRGTWGYHHNDHVWVLFYDGSTWQPLDSELNIIGIKDFVIRRWEKISPYYFKLLPYGPPFIIWEDAGDGFLNMKTITKQIWMNKPDSTYTKVNKSEWFRFLNEFDGVTREKLDHSLFPSDKEIRIKRMSKLWF
jgi:hypothetical protein